MNCNLCARFQSLSETKLIKNCCLSSWFKKHASWFRKRVSCYITWNTWELKSNSTILTHSKSKLTLILSILIVIWWTWIVKSHLWYFVTFGVAYDYVPFRPCTKPLRNVDHVTLVVPFSRTDVFKNSFFVRIRRLWNELLLSITESNTLSIFPKNLMAFYYDKFNVNFS